MYINVSMYFANKSIDTVAKVFIERKNKKKKTAIVGEVQALMCNTSDMCAESQQPTHMLNLLSKLKSTFHFYFLFFIYFCFLLFTHSIYICRFIELPFVWWKRILWSVNFSLNFAIWKMVILQPCRKTTKYERV